MSEKISLDSSVNNYLFCISLNQLICISYFLYKGKVMFWFMQALLLVNYFVL